MNFLHSEITASQDDTIVVTVNGQCNVLLLDDCSFSNYRAGRSYRYIGGWAKVSPVHLTPTHHGCWHVVIDLAGRAGRIRAGIRVLSLA